MTCLSANLQKSNPANFELTFPLIPGQTQLGAVNELVLNIHGTVLPSVTVPQLESWWLNTKRQQAGGPVDFEQLTVQFVIDSQFKNWKVIFDWLMFIANNKDKMMENSSLYTVDATLRIIDNFNNDVLGIKFIGMFPNNLQEVGLSYKEGEILLEGGSTFMYDYFEVIENL